MSTIKILLSILILWILCLSVTCTCLNVRVENVERAYDRLYTMYLKTEETAQRMEHVNNQTLKLLSEGGWEAWEKQ